MHTSNRIFFALLIASVSVFGSVLPSIFMPTAGDDIYQIAIFEFFATEFDVLASYA
jgi:hypothetical protein